MVKIRCSEKVTNEILEWIREKRTHLNSILCTKANWACHILRRNCLLNDTTERQITEVKEVERR